MNVGHEPSVPIQHTQSSMRNCELVVQILHAACAAGVAATFSSLLGGVLLSLDSWRIEGGMMKFYNGTMGST